MNRRGFTLIELLVVIAIIALLLTLGSKGLRTAKVSAKKAQAMVEMKAIETAVKAYMHKYGKLPTASPEDVQFSIDDGSPRLAESEAVVSLLTMAADADTALNPAQTIFLEPQSNGSDGTFNDPWGFQYRIGLDSDYDGQLVVDGETIRRKIVVVSIGLYSSSGRTNDIIRSWQ